MVLTMEGAACIRVSFGYPKYQVNTAHLSGASVTVASLALSGGWKTCLNSVPIDNVIEAMGAEALMITSR